MPGMKLALLCVALAAVVASAQPVGQGAVSGVVLEASSGDPVRKAIVTLTWQGTPPSWATVRTDGSGQFKFEGLPAGRYTLRATKAGVGTATYGAGGLRELGEFLMLDEGENRAGVKLRFIRTSTISGRVLDSDGDPMVGVNVALQRPGRNRGDRILLPYRGTTTNDRGEYKITAIDPGQYYLQSNPSSRIRYSGPTPRPLGEDAVHDILVAQFYPSAHEVKDAQLLTLHDGESQTGFDFHMFAEQAVRIRGRVTGVPPVNPENPGFLQAVDVMLAPAEPEQRQQWTNRVSAQFPDFGFEFPEVRAGRYRISAKLLLNGKTYAASQLTDFGAGSGDISLPLSPALDLKGRLTFDGPTSQPLNSFTIFLIGVGRETLSGRVGDGGRFTIPQVMPGEWAFNMNPVPVNGFLKSVHLGDQDVRFTSLWIEPGSDAQFNVVISTRTATIEGDIDADGADSKRAGILLAPFGKYHTLTRFYYVALADDHGKFTISGIAPGTYKIFALEKIATISCKNPESADLLEALGEDVNITEGDKLQLHPKLIPYEKAREALGR